MHLNETPNVPAEKSKLPVKIWIDDTGNSKQHSKYYIKIFPKGRSFRSDGVELTVSENPAFPKTQPNLREFGIESWEIECVRQWIKDNLAELRTSCEGNLDIFDLINPDKNKNYVKPKTKFELSSSKSETQATTGEFPSTVPASVRSPEPVAESFLQYARRRMLNKQMIEFGLPPIP